MNPLKKRLHSGRPCIGAWLTVPSPQVAEALATCGFHWLCVDMEHSPVDESAALLSFIAAERHGVAPVVRLPSADPYLARRMLDSGAMGIIVPTVETSDDFAGFASHCLYPPKGRRGTGLSRACGWGDTFDEYIGTFEPVLVPQIETMRGVENARAIADLPSVDAIFLGPYDLSQDLGTPGDFTTTGFRNAVDRVREACRDTETIAGFHQVGTDSEALQDRIDEGYRFLAFGTDVLAMKGAYAGLALLEGFDR